MPYPTSVLAVLSILGSIAFFIAVAAISMGFRFSNCFWAEYYIRKEKFADSANYFGVTFAKMILSSQQITHAINKTNICFGAIFLMFALCGLLLQQHTWIKWMWCKVRFGKRFWNCQGKHLQ